VIIGVLAIEEEELCVGRVPEVGEAQEGEVPNVAGVQVEIDHVGPQVSHQPKSDQHRHKSYHFIYCDFDLFSTADSLCLDPRRVGAERLLVGLRLGSVGAGELHPFVFLELGE